MSEESNDLIFEYSPIGLIEEDFSLIVLEMEKIVLNKGETMENYFVKYPKKIIEFSKLLIHKKMNAKAREIYQIDSFDNEYQNIQNAFTSNSLKSFAHELVAIYNKQSEYSVQTEFKINSGEIFFTQLSWKVVPGYDNYSKVVVSIIDITEKVELDKQINLDKIKYENLFENSPIGIWIEDFSEIKKIINTFDINSVYKLRRYFDINPDIVIDLATKISILDVNKQAMILHQVKDKHKLLSINKDAISDIMIETFKDQFCGIYLGLTNLSFQSEMIRSDGKLTEVLIYWNVSPGHEKDYSRVLLSMVDITEQEDAIERSKELFENYQFLFNQSPVAIWDEDFSEVKTLLDNIKLSENQTITDYFNEHPELVLKATSLVRIIDINEYAVKLFKAESKQSLIEDIKLCFTDKSMSSFQKEIEAIYLGLKEFNVLANMQTVTGEELEVLIYFNISDRYADNLSRILVSMIDITEQKMIERQLYQSQKMDALGRFAGNINHDLNNILMAILGYTDIVLLDDNVNTIKKDVEEIKKATLKATALTNQLSSFSKEGAHILENIDIINLIKGMKNLLIRLLSENVQLKVIIPNGSFYVSGDKSKIEQAVMNLIVNANEAIESTGVIYLVVEHLYVKKEIHNIYNQIVPGNYVVISVKDNGRGIKDDTINNLFEPFFTTKSNNTGLGLSIVFNCMKQSNGMVDMQSIYGKGTEARLYFPKVNKIIKPKSKENKDINYQKSLKILLIDDDKLVLDAVYRLLDKDKHDVLRADGGKQAELIWREHRDEIDLIITDIIMPHINGPDLMNKILSKDDTVKIIYMSGYADDYLSRKGIGYDEINFIPKPFTLQNLREKLRELFNE